MRILQDGPTSLFTLTGMIQSIYAGAVSPIMHPDGMAITQEGTHSTHGAGFAAQTEKKYSRAVNQNLHAVSVAIKNYSAT